VVGREGLHFPASLRGGRVVSGEVGPSLRFVELAVGAEEDVDQLGGEGHLVLRVRGLGYIGDDADDGAALLAGQDVVTDRVGVIEDLEAERCVDEDDLLCVGCGRCRRRSARRAAGCTAWRSDPG
jgi:hypothetical protein